VISPISLLYEHNPGHRAKTNSDQGEKTSPRGKLLTLRLILGISKEKGRCLNGWQMRQAIQ
jgi:hypothetical protein